MPTREILAQDYRSKAIFFIKSLKNNLSPKFKKEISQILDWDERKMNDFQLGKLELDAIGLSKLAAHFNFSLKAFEEDRVDFKTINDHRNGKEDALPERYTKGPLTMGNVIINDTLEQVGKFFGAHLKECALNDLQIGDYTSKYPDKYLSIQTLSDLYDFLASYGLNETDIEYLGASCCRAVLNKPEMKELSNIPCDQEFFKAFFNFVSKYVASHFIFNIVENSSHQFILDLTHNQEVEKHFAPERIGSHLTCCNMLGGFKNTFVHRGIHPIASHPKCIHRGDAVCRFNFDF
ncbi:MAG: hypothetical protein E2O68_09455 [Deltaproteobacteria bacterium]|nr:MAG: hypothetical protein E2O68_09455 [Deltaproteobacteria bacterium]